MIQPTFVLGWVRAPILNQFKGITSDMLKKDKAQGLYVEDKHWRKDGKGRIWWNFEAMNEHIEHGFKEAS